jgi:hypothetical protein
MARTILFALTGVVVAVACSEDSDTTSSQTGTQSTNQSSSTSSQGGSTGGQGSGAQGGGGNGVGGMGACASCNDYLSDPASVAVTDVCGVEMYDPATGELTCAPGSSCELLGTLFECACGNGCPDSDECGPSWCMFMPPDQACTTCLGEACTEPNDACIAD